MEERLKHKTIQLPPLGIWATCVTFSLIVFWVHLATGRKFHIPVFYVIPSVALSWYLSTAMGSSFGLMAAVAWTAAALLRGHPHSAVILAWNTALRASFFVIASVLAARLRQTLPRDSAETDSAHHTTYGRLLIVILSGVVMAVLASSILAYMDRRQRASEEVSVNIFRLPSGPIFVSEAPDYPDLQALRREEGLDQVVRAHARDFDKILALAQWASRQFKATSPFPHYPPWDARVILERIRHGKTGGFCAQYAFVFGQACESFGFIPRYVDLASPGNNNGHFTTEVYVPSLGKWVVFEAEYGTYYADALGIPLSALVLHQYAVGERKGRVFMAPDQGNPSQSSQFYYFRYYLRNNFLSVPVYAARPRGHLTFSPYRIVWSDRYTNDAPHMQRAIPSNDPTDFDFRLGPAASNESYCRYYRDIYDIMVREPDLQPKRIRMNRRTLQDLIEKDFVHDKTYRPLDS
jgi:hypothetical protein